MKKQKKKGSSLKGLIFILIILSLVGIYLFWYFTKSNLCVTVTVYKNSKTMPNAEVSIENKKAKTLADGTANLFVRADIGDTLKVIAKEGDLSDSAYVIADEERLKTEYTNADILLDRKLELTFFNFYPMNAWLK